MNRIWQSITVSWALQKIGKRKATLQKQKCKLKATKYIKFFILILNKKPVKTIEVPFLCKKIISSLNKNINYFQATGELVSKFC